MDKKSIVWALSGIWAALFVAGFVAFQLTEATGDSFTRGMNRIGAFLTFQGWAALVAVASWLVVGRIDEPRDRWLKFAGYAPPIVSGTLFGCAVLLVMALMLFGRY